MAAIEHAMSAGCVFAVRVKSASAPFHMRSDKFWSNAESTSSKTSRADGNASARDFPIPTNWLPCPDGHAYQFVEFKRTFDIVKPPLTMVNYLKNIEFLMIRELGGWHFFGKQKRLEMSRRT